MKNLWPDSFDETQSRSPKEIVEEQLALLPKLTGDMVFGSIRELSEIDAALASLTNDFAFSVELESKFIENYRFRVMSFSHDIALYPVKFKYDELLAKEFGIDVGFIVTVHDEAADAAEFEGLLSKVLKSDRGAKVIGAMIKLLKVGLRVISRTWSYRCCQNYSHLKGGFTTKSGRWGGSVLRSR